MTAVSQYKPAIKHCFILFRNTVVAVAILYASACHSRQQVGKSRVDTAEVYDSTSIAIDKRIADDPGVEALIAPFRKIVSAEVREIVARAPKAIEMGRPEGPLGDFVADAIRSAASRAVGFDVQVAFSNAGGIRNVIPAGDVTVGALYEVMPFDNTIVVFELPGEALQKMLDSMAARGGDPISGVRFLIQNKRATQVMCANAALDPKRIYHVATNDYVFDGGSRLQGLDAASNAIRTEVLLRDALIQWVRERAKPNGSLSVEIDGRVRTEVSP